MSLVALVPTFVVKFVVILVDAPSGLLVPVAAVVEEDEVVVLVEVEDGDSECACSIGAASQRSWVDAAPLPSRSGGLVSNISNIVE